MAETETVTAAEAPSTSNVVSVTDWRSGLPEDLRTEKSLADFKDVGTLAKSWVNVQPLIGAKIPEGLTASQVTEYLTKKGAVPAAPDKYAVKAPTFPEGMDLSWDADLQSSFLAEAHAAGFDNAQAQRMVDWYGRAMLRAHDHEIVQTAAAEKQAEATMRREWGSAYERNLGLARAAAADLFGNDPEMLAAFEARGNNPAVLKGLHRVGEVLFERGEIRGDAIGGGRTVDELEAEINKIREDPKNAGSIPAGERIVALITERNRLRERLAK